MKAELTKYVAICLVLLAGVPAFLEAAPRKWNYVQPLEVEAEGPVKVDLPYETLDKSRPDLSDLRLLNPEGRMVPFLLRREKPERIKYRRINTYDFSRSETQTVVNVVTGVGDRRIDALELEVSNRKYLKSVAVESSDDYESWRRLVGGATIFGSRAGPGNSVIELPPGKRKYLRLIIDDRQSTPVDLESIRVRVLPDKQPPTRELELEVRERRQQTGRTVLNLRLPYRNLPVNQLHFSVSNPGFKREVDLFEQTSAKGVEKTRRVGDGTIYRFRAENGRNQRLAVPVNHRFESRHLRLDVKNRDNPPLEIKSLTATVPENKLIFWARRPGTYRLLAGNRVAESPDYRLDWLSRYVESMELTELRPGGLRANEKYSRPEKLPELPARGASFEPGRWKYRKQLKLNSPGIKWLELPAAVLAKSSSTRRDLRLGTEGRQIPYVADERTITRPLNAETVKVSRRRRDEKSRYKFELPFSNLPLISVSVEPENELYEREVVLFEKTRGRGGKLNRRVLGRSTWRRTPGETGGSERVHLRKRPRTGELYLEVDNGDNAPLELSGFEFNYQTHRLFFKTEKQQPVYLYYGNEAATAPDYDISLVKTSLLNSQADQARLGPEVRLDRSTWWETDFTGSTTRIIFWAVIIFVTAALLVVIVRLLPELETEPD